MNEENTSSWGPRPLFTVMKNKWYSIISYDLILFTYSTLIKVFPMINCVFLSWLCFRLGVFLFLFFLFRKAHSESRTYRFSLQQKGCSPRWPADGARGRGSADEAVLAPRDTPPHLFSPGSGETRNQPSLSCVSSAAWGSPPVITRVRIVRMLREQV